MIEKVFKAYEVLATYPNPLDSEAAWKVGLATGLYLKRSRQNLGRGQKVALENTVVVGRDMRPGGAELCDALTAGLRSTGMNVIDLGMIDTPMIYFAINHLECVGGIQTTASHMPAGYNGFKINGPSARPIGSSSGLDDIRRITGTLRVGNTGLQGAYEQRDLWEPYRQHVLKFLSLKRPLHVLVDGGSGIAGKMIAAVFADQIKLKITPLVSFLATGPDHEPTSAEDTLKALKAAVLREKADMGVCFDADADSCVFVDENAQAIGGDICTAFLAQDLLKMPANQGATIVYDLRSSRIVAETIGALGGAARRERAEPALIRKAMAQSNAVLGGDLSGHLYFRGNFFAESAAIAFARVLSVVSAQNQPLGALVAPYRKYARSGEMNFQVEDKEGKLRELAEAYRKAKTDYLDGLTVDNGDWWFNVRKSDSEPILRLNLEAPNQGLLAEKLAELKKLLGEVVGRL